MPGAISTLLLAFSNLATTQSYNTKIASCIMYHLGSGRIGPQTTGPNMPRTSRNSCFRSNDDLVSWRLWVWAVVGGILPPTSSSQLQFGLTHPATNISHQTRSGLIHQYLLKSQNISMFFGNFCHKFQQYYHHHHQNYHVNHHHHHLYWFLSYAQYVVFDVQKRRTKLPELRGGES